MSRYLMHPYTARVALLAEARKKGFIEAMQAKADRSHPVTFPETVARYEIAELNTIDFSLYNDTIKATARTGTWTIGHDEIEIEDGLFPAATIEWLRQNTGLIPAKKLIDHPMLSDAAIGRVIRAGKGHKIYLLRKHRRDHQLENGCVTRICNHKRNGK